MATDLIAEAGRGDAAAVQALLAKGADANGRNIVDLTALYVASIAGHREVVRVLLANGADIDAKNGNAFGLGVTALMGASLQGQLEAVQSLLDNGADVNLRSARGLTGNRETGDRRDVP